MNGKGSNRASLHSCSTFMLQHDDSLLVGHNLDDYIEVPGLIVVNKRGTAKESISWAELSRLPFVPRNSKRMLPRVRWTSQYGSVTYNTGGKEFPDGGLNEAGLYVGEMTLMATRWPRRDDLPRLYHHLWMQYLLDNYERVDQVLESLSRVIVDGHCRWHFFVADRDGKAAAIEFLEGEAVVYAGQNFPRPLLCNATYASELERLGRYEGFGGSEPVDFQDTEHDLRFVYGATMLRQYEHGPSIPALDYVFKILGQIKGDNNKWGLVFDLRNPRMYFSTYKAGQTRYIDFSALDFSGSAPALMLDIHRDLAGDVSQYLASFDPQANQKTIFWNEVRSPGFVGLLMGKYVYPMIMQRMSGYASNPGEL